MDGFWESDLKPWDIAGGALIVAEAGGRVTNMDGEPFTSRGGHVLATNGHLHDAMLEVIVTFRRRACSEADGLISARDSRRRDPRRIHGRFGRMSAGIAPATSIAGTRSVLMRRLTIGSAVADAGASCGFVGTAGGFSSAIGQLLRSAASCRAARRRARRRRRAGRTTSISSRSTSTTSTAPTVRRRVAHRRSATTSTPASASATTSGPCRRSTTTSSTPTAPRSSRI